MDIYFEYGVNEGREWTKPEADAALEDVRAQLEELGVPVHIGPLEEPATLFTLPGGYAPARPLL